MSATLGERRRRPAKKQERENSKKDYREGLFHFSLRSNHSRLPGRSKLPQGTLALAGPTTAHILHLRQASIHLLRRAVDASASLRRPPSFSFISLTTIHCLLLTLSAFSSTFKRSNVQTCKRSFLPSAFFLRPSAENPLGFFPNMC
jgi:hypothetical protein